MDSLRMGGVYGFLRPATNASGRPGEWQTYDITLIGRRVTVVLNERTIVQDAEIPGITGGALDSDEGQPGSVDAAGRSREDRLSQGRADAGRAEYGRGIGGPP